MPSSNMEKTQAALKFAVDAGILPDQAGETFPVYAAAISAHRTHKNERLHIPVGNYLYGLYRDKSDQIAVEKSTQCFHPSTRVLTDRGYIPIQSIIVGDRVLTKGTGFQRVRAVYINHSGPLIAVRAEGMDNLLVTPNHPVFFYKYERYRYHYKRRAEAFSKLEILPVSEVRKGGYMIHPQSFSVAERGTADISAFSADISDRREGRFRVKNGQRFIPERIDLNYGSGVLFGFYLSEGHSRIQGTSFGFSFHLSEQNYANQVRSELIRVFGITPAVYYGEDNCIRVVANDRAAHSVFKEMGQGSKNKKPLGCFYSAPNEFMMGILYGIFCGDGRLKSRQVSLHVISEELRYFAKWILSRLGYISRNDGDTLWLNHDASTFIKTLCGVAPSEGYSRSVVLFDNIAVRVKETKSYGYNGPVYNLSVEGDNTYVANGYVVHNCGVSEYLVARAIYRASEGKVVLYVMPTSDLKNLFVKERFDKTIIFTPYYMSLLGDHRKFAESMSLKQFHIGSIAFAGSNSPNTFVSLPADDVIIDERDNCDQENLEKAEERQAASTDKTRVDVGNPTIPEYGIDSIYRKSDQKKWHIKCPRCGTDIVPDFFRHIVRQIGDADWMIIDKNYRRSGNPRAICHKCHKPFDRFSPGVWVPENPQSGISGYHISKMFSTAVTLRELTDRFEKGLVNDTVMQRFYNGDLGLAYTAKGSKISSEMLDACVRDYPMAPGGPAIAGIDVQKDYFVLIIAELGDETLRVNFIGIQNSEEELLETLKVYRVILPVIDAGPEFRISKRVAVRGGGFVCFNNLPKNELTPPSKDLVVNINRTAGLDAVKEYILEERLLLPKNAKSIEGFYRQMQSSTRVFNERRNSYDWLPGSNPDHYLHAAAYLLTARRILLSRS